MEIFAEPAVLTHRFGPVIFNNTTKLIVGTLPPETSEYYFSNSPRTRLWDILKTISTNSETIYSGSYLLATNEKEQILSSLNLGLCDIIKKYSRLIPDSVEDRHIIPLEYFNLPEIIKDTRIDTVLFVYQSAANWFLHSIKGVKPVSLEKLLKHYNRNSEFYSFEINGRKVKCILLPNPQNIGQKGETMQFKLEAYRAAISK